MAFSFSTSNERAVMRYHEHVKKFGPEVDTIVERESNLTAREVEHLLAIWYYTRDSMDEASMAMALAIADMEVDGDAIEDAIGYVADCIEDAMGMGNNVFYPVSCAALALVCKGRISQEHFDALTKPWREAVRDTEHLFVTD